MGFPVGYTEFLLPKFFLHLLSFLGFIRKSVSNLFRLVGLPDFLEPDNVSWHNQPSNAFSAVPLEESTFPTAAAIFAGEILPVVRFSDLTRPGSEPECCAVCRYEFEGDDEIRRLTNCRHIFHRSCVDRWMMVYHHMTCPLCRTPFISDALQDAFNQRAWAESGISELFGESS